MSKTFGRFTFGIWRDKGMQLDGGRKYWIRVGALIAYVEIADGVGGG
jgi:hypothetical protein